MEEWSACFAVRFTPSRFSCSFPSMDWGTWDSEALLRSADRLMVSDPKFNIETLKSLGLDVSALTASTFQPQINTTRLSGKRDGYLNRRTLVSIAGSRRCQ
jgi:hypothetical protein